MRKPISRPMHGVLDYVTGAVVEALPRALRIDHDRSGRILQASGAGHVGYSTITDYELGLKRILPMRGHLAIDAAGAVGLAAAPFVTGAARKGRRHWMPHVMLAAYELTSVALTDPDRPRRRRGIRRAAPFIGRVARAAGRLLPGR